MMIFRKTGLRLAWLMLLAWVIPALACNLPRAANTSGVVSGEALRQTLEAQEARPPAAQPTGQGQFPSQPEATPAPGPAGPQPSLSPTAAPSGEGGFIDYTTQSGDTLLAVARRFQVSLGQITASQALPEQGLLDPGLVLHIPNVLDPAPYTGYLFPDGEVINSPTTIGFDVEGYIAEAGGYLSTYHEDVDGVALSGAQIIARQADEYSINPRLLLAFLEFRSGWVLGQPKPGTSLDYPVGFKLSSSKGLDNEILLLAKQFNVGYYGWRSGLQTALKFADQSRARLSPELNAGTVALQWVFSRFYAPGPWQDILYGPQGFLDLYRQMFGDYAARAAAVEPLFRPGLVQPELELPFRPGQRWSLTGGPHVSWDTGSPAGAIDFSPVTGEPACSVSRVWVTAPAGGVVTRSADNVVALDLDGDGHEQTGWVLVFMHVADKDRVAKGAQVNEDDHLGHPSCEGGKATGTHVHLARKYNGEWIPIDGTLPFILSGWEVKPGPRPYQGYLVQEGKLVTANPGGNQSSIIIR
jgi:LasA protease